MSRASELLEKLQENMLSVVYTVNGKRQVLGMPEKDFTAWEARMSKTFSDFKVLKK